MRKALFELVKSIVAAASTGADDVQLSEDKLTDLRVEHRAEVITDPRTMRPREATYETVATATLRGEKDPRRIVERHSYTFAWPEK